MENYFLDRLRSNGKDLPILRQYLVSEVAGRDCIVIGSAPDPVVPNIKDAYVLCVNGSVHSAYRYISAKPHLTYLNGAIFKNTDDYSNATISVLREKHLGDLLISKYTADLCLQKLDEIQATYGRAFVLSRFDKRVIMGQALGYTSLGRYRHKANVSNGLFMASVALWAKAASVTLVGFSFNNRHEYSKNAELSKRGHVEEDCRFLELMVSGRFPVLTTSQEIHNKFKLVLSEARPDLPQVR